MKNLSKFIAFFVATMVLLPTVLFAASFNFGQDYSLRKEEAVNEDLYAVSGNTAISGDVFGDLYAVGGTVFAGSNISQDIFLVGINVSSLADVGGDERIAGINTIIGGDIKEDLVVVSGETKILPGTNIFGDAYIIGSRVILDGEISGKATITGGTININGIVNGPLQISANEVIIGPNAVIRDGLVYSASKTATIDSSATITGEITFNQVNTRSGINKFIPTFFGIWVLIKFAILLLGALVMHGIFRRISERFVSVGISNFWKSLLWGFLFVISVPIAALFVILTFVGIPFVLLAVSVYITMLVLSFFYTPILVGSIASRITQKDKDLVVTWKIILLGVVITLALDYLSYFGDVARFVIFLTALGSIVTVLLHKFSEVR